MGHVESNVGITMSEKLLLDAGEDEEIPFVNAPSQDCYSPIFDKLLTHA